MAPHSVVHAKRRQVPAAVYAVGARRTHEQVPGGLVYHDLERIAVHYAVRRRRAAADTAPATGTHSPRAQTEGSSTVCATNELESAKIRRRN